MPRRHAFGVLLSSALLLAGSAGCDVGKTNIFDGPKPSPAGAGAGAGGGASAGTGGGGSGPIAPGGPCASAGDCKDQVCSPGGTCVDCNEDKDCLVNQYCDQTHCVAKGGNTGGAGGGGGSGGAGAVTTCGGAQVLFVVQRSGIMFEQPDAEANYWGMVRDAIAGDDGALDGYFDKLAVGALFFVRVQDADECPVLSRAEPAVGAMKGLAELFTSNAAEYQTLADAQSKMDAPVPEALAAATSLLTGTARHVVLITTGVADTCTDTDNACLMDPAIKAVQDAHKAGVTTHVIGMGDTGLLDTESDQDGYQTYLKQLANAGQGKSVKKSSGFDAKCSDDNAKATYSNDNGDAKAYRAESTGDVKGALDEILKSICP